MGKKRGKKLQQQQKNKKLKNLQQKATKKQKKESKKEKRRGKKHKEFYEKHWKDFNNLLRPHGLTLFECRADGNCLFRSFADQLERNQALHATYRSECIKYMRSHTDEFAPFMEEDFAEYCDEMAKDSEWGGNFEIIALGRAYRVNVVIHHETDPRYEILYDGKDPKGTIHLSYHDDSHYNSVRPLDEKKTGATDILAPNRWKDPTYEEKPVPEAESSPSKKKKGSKSAKERFEETRSAKTGGKALHKMTRKERKKLKKQEKAMKAKKREEARKEAKKEKVVEPPKNDLGAIRI